MTDKDYVNRLLDELHDEMDIWDVVETPYGTLIRVPLDFGTPDDEEES